MSNTVDIKFVEMIYRQSKSIKPITLKNIWLLVPVKLFGKAQLVGGKMLILIIRVVKPSIIHNHTLVITHLPAVSMAMIVTTIVGLINNVTT